MTIDKRTLEQCVGHNCKMCSVAHKIHRLTDENKIADSNLMWSVFRLSP